MKNTKLGIFVLILLLGLTVVSAADVIDDDSSAVAVEELSVDYTDMQEEIQINNEENIDEGDNTDPGANPTQYNSLTDGNSYENAVITLDADATYTDASVTFLNNVTLTSDLTTRTLNNMKIVITGNNITIGDVNLNHQNTATATKVIDIVGGSDVNINDVEINLAENQLFTTMGISATSVSHDVIINNSIINVQSAAQGQIWQQDASGNWYSTLAVSAVVFDNSNNIQLENSTVNIINTTSDLLSYTTMPAVTVRNNVNLITIKNNTITSTGARYVYGIMMNDLVNNVEIENNTVSVSGVYYVAGIDASTASNSKVSKNKVTAISENATTFPDGYESLAYGIISDTYSSGNIGNHICQNNITISANVCYGVEMYRGMNNFICSNKIESEGIRVMGVAIAFTNNTKIINNVMDLTGSDDDYNYFYEEITPVNTGIIFTNQSNGNWIQGNNISITASNYEGISAINLQNSTTATVTGNLLKAQNTSTPITGNMAIKVDSLCSDMNIGTNNGIVLYNCDCGCMSNNNGVDETESISEAKFFYTKNIKKETEDNEIIIVDESNYLQYGKYSKRLRIYTFYSDAFTDGSNVIINFTGDTFSSLRTIKGINNDNINLLAVYYSGTGYTIPGAVDLWLDLTNVTNLYAPTSNVWFSLDSVSLTNSTLYTVDAGWTNFVGENNTFYSNTVYLRQNEPNTIFRNNYLVHLDYDTQTVTCGLDTTTMDIGNCTLENNGPNYENAKLLNNSNYNTYFNEDNTLKSEYADNVLFAVENITNPVIINAPVTLTAFRGIGGYSNVSFIGESDNSVIEDSFINKLTLNTTSGIKVNNNKLLSDDSIIEVINSLGCIIENNTINTKNEYTIALDADSLDNVVRNNELYASELTGDRSVSSSEDNTVESNLPLPVPELKVDTIEFEVGSSTNIQASIYLGDDVASDISGGKVIFKVNGKTLKDENGKIIYAKLVNGQATIENYVVPETWAKDGLTISAVYSGTTKTESLRSEAVEITVSTTEPTFTTNDISTTKEGTITLSATITDGDKVINTGKVIFKINGKTVKDANGKIVYAKVTDNVASFEYTLPAAYKAQTYNITAVLMSSSYGKLNDTKTLTVTA